MGLAKTEEQWQERARAFLKGQLKQAGMTYADLIKRLKKYGFRETESSITMKLKRGTFSATFFLACLAAIGRKSVALAEI